MKFEDYLVEQGDHPKQHNKRRIALEEDVANLQADLDEQQAIGKLLHSALHGPVIPPHPCIASLLPPQVQGLLAEMAIVEEEITWLEKKLDDLKLSFYFQRKLTKKVKHQRRKSKHHNNPLLLCEPLPNHSLLSGDVYQVSRSLRHVATHKDRFKIRTTSAGSAEEVLSVLPTDSSPSKPKKQHRARVPTQKEPLPYAQKSYITMSFHHDSPYA